MRISNVNSIDSRLLRRRMLNCFDPNINIARDPRWGRVQETYGEDPHLTGTLAAHFVRGLQGGDKRFVKVRSQYPVPALKLRSCIEPTVRPCMDSPPAAQHASESNVVIDCSVTHR